MAIRPTKPPDKIVGIELDDAPWEIEESQANTPRWKAHIHKHALMYVNLGYFPLPMRPGTKILPTTNGGVNYGSVTLKVDTINKWFHPDSGKFAGWNIGLGCGKEGGILVVDIDVKNPESNGEDALNALELQHKDTLAAHGGPIQTTPSGGKHYLFKWELGGRKSESAIGPGIDTRGGEADTCRSHIGAFPSVIKYDDGEFRMYKPVAGRAIHEIAVSTLPSVPEWVMDKLGERRAPARDVGRGSEEVGAGDEETIVPLPQVARMLEHIDPDELTYDQWLRIGQAINSQHPNSDGLKAWDDWSQRGERYKDRECRTRWPGFRPDGAVRIGTLFYYAHEGGWEAVEGDAKSKDRMAETVERLNANYAVIQEGSKVRVLSLSEKRQRSTDKGYSILTAHDFKTKLLHDVVFDSKGKPTKVADVWLNNKARNEFMGGLALCPPGVECAEGVYNTWTGFTVAPKKGDCGLFLDHIKRVICGGNEFHYNWTLDWCASLCQKPGKLLGTAIVMRGDEGSGKGTFANTVGELFGPHYVHLIDESHLTSNFNAHLAEAIVIFADEITWGGNKKSAGKLKGMVTEPTRLIERKGLDAVNGPNMIHMMIASNSEWVIPAGPNSRRWFVLDVINPRTRDRGYWKAIYDELDNGGREALLYELLNRKITNDLTRAPETDALQDQRSKSNPNQLLRFCASLLAEGEADMVDGANGFISVGTLREKFVAWYKDHEHEFRRETSVNIDNIRTEILAALNDGLAPGSFVAEGKERKLHDPQRNGKKNNKGILFQPIDVVAEALNVKLQGRLVDNYDLPDKWTAWEAPQTPRGRGREDN